MATSLPWSVKGVDPRTRDAAKAAARRAGMTLGEWLDRKILDESGRQPVEAQPEQLDIAALSERLARLSSGQMDTAPRAPAAPSPRASRPEPSRGEIDALLGKAESFEKLTRESDARTAGALDSIARWIEKTETRISAGERNAAERQERATNVIAEAIKTMGERLADIERRSAEAPRAQQAPRLAFNRDALAAAVTDIKTRQRLLDQDGASAPAPEQSASESRLSAIRNDLRELSARLAPAAPPPAPVRPAAPARDTQLDALTGMISALGTRLDNLDRRERLEPILKPLARIESEVGRLAQEQHGDSYRGIEREISHLAAKVDTLAARGGDGAALEPVLRDIADLREMLAAETGGGKLEELAQQVSTLAFEISRLRDAQPDGRELRNLSMALDDVRGAVMSDRAERAREHPAAAASLAALSRQIEQLAGRLDEVATQRPTDQVEDRIDALQQRIETLLEHGPAAVTRQIEALAGRIEALAASNDLAQIVNEGKSVKVAQVDLSPVEDMLRSLAAKIDEAGRPGADTAAFDALEQQIAGLADRLDAAAAKRSAETGLERTLEDLVVHLRSLHEDNAADRAAIADIASRSASPSSGIAELSSLVSGLRDSHVTAGRQTQDAIGAVHQTLETIISRLASLETELASERDGQAERAVRPRAPSLPPAATPSPAPAAKAAAFGTALADRLRPQPTPPRIEPALQDGPAPSPAPGLDAPLDTPLDLPLEPGSGRPRPDNALAGGSDPQSIRQSLIAAARRSAKAASEAAAAAPAPAPEPAKSKGRLRDMMSKRKKPLLLGLAALVLALGTAHVVTGSLKGGKQAPGENETAKSLIAPSARQEAEPQPAPESSARTEAATLAAPQPAAPTQAAAPVVSVTAPGLAPAPEITGSTTQPETATPAVQPVTGIGELPATLGTPGMRKAAMEGDARAVYELASRAVDGPAGGRDLKLALRLFERAAVAGLTPAQFRLGNMFEKGTGTPRDIALARTWYQRAADRGNAKAMHNLAVLHAEGVTGKPDYATATEWFRKAADLGVRDSQYNLAVLLGRGLGAPTDLGQSYVWFSVAATQGDEDAGKKRDEVAQRLEPAELAAARALASQWKPKPLDPAANEVTPPARGWDASPSASATKPPKQAKL